MTQPDNSVALPSEKSDGGNLSPAKPRSRIRTILSNTVSLMASDVINRLTSFVIYALVGRYMGAFAFGQISLALSLFFTFQVFAVAGLRLLVTREVAKNQELTDRYWINSSLAVFFTSQLSFFLMIVFVNSMGYASRNTELVQSALGVFGTTFTDYNLVLSNAISTVTVIALVCLGLLPFALSQMSEAIFLAWERMSFIVYVSGTINVLRIALLFIIVTSGYGLYEVATLMFVSHVLILLGEWYFLFRHIVKPNLKFDLGLTINLLKKSSAFLGAQALIAIMSSLQILLLATILTERDAGLYSSAAQLVTPLSVFYRSIVLSFYPMMCQRFDTDSFKGLRRIVGVLMEMLMFISVPVSVGLYFMSEWALQFLYSGQEFREAGIAVDILVWVMFLRVFTSVWGQVLYAGMRERTTVRIVGINLIVALIGGMYFIHEYGMIGAAYASVLVVLSDIIQHYIPVSKMLNGIPIIQVLWRPVLASAIMGVYLHLVGAAEVYRNDKAFLVILGGIIVYSISLLVIMLITVGGPKAIRAKYLGIATR